MFASKPIKAASPHFLFKKQNGMAHTAYVFWHPALNVRMHPVGAEGINGAAGAEASVAPEMNARLISGELAQVSISRTHPLIVRAPCWTYPRQYAADSDRTYLIADEHKAR
jgi:hypothetical protein